MCGICGIYNIDGRPVDPDLLERMNNTMIHRGPDEEGYYINAGRLGSQVAGRLGGWEVEHGAWSKEQIKKIKDRNVLRQSEGRGNVGLGHRRLSIIDLSTGQQPLCNEDGSIWIAFNGEIYNFQDLMKKLKGLGHRFATRSDTETIIHGYEEWGEKFVERLRGMFAIALWDGRNHKLVLARDRVGKT